ncbi:putative Thiaminase-2/PQQC domain-containing protein [Seiridium cardinale]
MVSVSPPDTQIQTHQGITLVETLWQENQDLVDKFLNNEFIKFQAEEEQNVTLPSYQYYSTQDYYYLVNYVQYKALRMTTYSEVYPTQLLSVMTEETAAISGDIDYAWSYRNTTLAGDLAVPLNAIDSGALDVAQIAYSDWLQKNLDLGWFTMHVQSIPCIYVCIGFDCVGWVKLAEYWAEKNTTRKGEIAAGHDHSLLRRFELTQVSRADTLFYHTWIEPNNDPSYADDLISFLEANKDAYYSVNANQTWTAVFREALQFEIDFFDSALGKSPADL